jgi:lysophospholipase L1-like esterase
MSGTLTPASKQVIAVRSRHPRLGQDYDARAHAFISSYTSARQTYTVDVRAFPGALVLVQEGDQQLPPGSTKDDAEDIQQLMVPLQTVAFEFLVEGQVRSPRPGPIPGKRPTPFRKSAVRPLPSVFGNFRRDDPEAPWNCTFKVPGEGTYEVTVNYVLKSGARQRQGGPHRIAVRDFLMVAIGDSMSSGQGNPDVPGEPAGFEVDFSWWDLLFPQGALYKLSAAALDRIKEEFKEEFTTLARARGWTLKMDPRPVWLEPRAYRSLLSGPALAARLLEDTESGRLVTFLPFGRSGSEVRDGLIGPRTSGGKPVDGWIGNIGQVEEVARTLGRRRIDALVVTIGINDIGVASTLEDFVKGDSAVFTSGDDGTERDKVEQRARANLARLPANFDALEAALRRVNVRHVYLTEYPTALFDGPDGEPSAGCGIFDSWFDMDLTGADARLLKRLAVDLNATLREQAERRGWFFVDGIAKGFTGHGYCRGGEDRWFVQAEESMGLQGDTEGTVHPNLRGHKFIARAIANAVRRHTIENAEGPSTDDEVVKVRRGSAKPRGVKKAATAQPRGIRRAAAAEHRSGTRKGAAAPARGPRKPGAKAKARSAKPRGK